MSDEIADLVDRARTGETGARDALFAAAYNELRVLARSRLRDGGRHTLLATTVLVHECYLRICCSHALQAESKRAFFAYASQVMRSAIIDMVRECQAERRGGKAECLTLDTDLVNQLPASEDGVLKINEALEALAQSEPRLATVVEMRYFGGYSENQIADVLKITDRTVRRDWEKARLLLLAMISD